MLLRNIGKDIISRGKSCEKNKEAIYKTRYNVNCSTAQKQWQSNFMNFLNLRTHIFYMHTGISKIAFETASTSVVLALIND